MRATCRSEPCSRICVQLDVQEQGLCEPPATAASSAIAPGIALPPASMQSWQSPSSRLSCRSACSERSVARMAASYKPFKAYSISLYC